MSGCSIKKALPSNRPQWHALGHFQNLKSFHWALIAFIFLCSKSQAFLQFGKILNQTKYRTSLYDSSLNPSDKYKFISNTKPELMRAFPLKIIASYLKITPETLSRVRAAN